ncbi:MAG: hemolysin III family protein [Deltaproteobacteria bacterium]|nr:hemolysin III family protein [Deltaproteobacteria bacterium]
MNSCKTYELPPRKLGEEIANSITHGIGWLLAIVGLIVLVVEAAQFGNAWHIVSCSIYAATLVFMYAASTLYHSLTNPRAKFVFRVIEHSAIFILIAGTYTPLTLVSLRGPWGWSIFGVVWGIAIVGILFKTLLRKRFSWLSTLLYVLMGWIIVVALKPLLQMFPAAGLKWLLWGGLFYTVGAGIYSLKRLPYGHTVWHVFVLAGSACHYFAIKFYVIP